MAHRKLRLSCHNLAVYLLVINCSTFSVFLSQLNFIFSCSFAETDGRGNARLHVLVKDYDMKLHYHPGKANIVVDALSRKSYANTLVSTGMPKELAEDIREL